MRVRWGLRYRLPVYSMVLYLSPGAGRTDPGTYGYGNDTLGLRLNYKVVRLSELEGSPFLESPSIGLLPFTPLMRPPMGLTSAEWVEACVSKTYDAAGRFGDRVRRYYMRCLFLGV